MKIYEERTIPVRKDKFLIERKCDLCGRKAKTEDWGAGLYKVNETEINISIKQKEGEQYPEGGWGTKYEIDLCPECFKNKLIPWLKSEGANIEEKEWNW